MTDVFLAMVILRTTVQNVIVPRSELWEKTVTKLLANVSVNLEFSENNVIVVLLVIMDFLNKDVLTVNVMPGAPLRTRSVTMPLENVNANRTFKVFDVRNVSRDSSISLLEKDVKLVVVILWELKMKHVIS